MSGGFSDLDALAAVLDWYAATGVDVALGDDPVDRFAESRLELERAAAARAATLAAHGAARPRGETQNGTPASGRNGVRPIDRPPPGAARDVPMPSDQPRFEPAPQPVARPAGVGAVPGEEAVVAAREAARSAASLDELRAILERFEGCNLRQTARRLCFADGNPQARVMLVGEAPGRDEDEAGVPFVGRSGQLLDRMLAAIGLDRTKVYIANVVPWRPPGNRTPTPQETEICKPFIQRQIELANPDVLVFLGGASAAAIAGTTEGILKLRGRWMKHRVAGREIDALPTLHPAYLLRQPLQKKLAWRDFRELRAVLARTGDAG